MPAYCHILINIIINSHIIYFFIQSGGAFVIETGGKSYIRGIVSAAIRDEAQTCDHRQYAVFTDVTRFNDWIESFIRTYG